MLTIIPPQQQLEEQSVKHKEEIELAQRQAVELKGNEIQQLQLSHEEKEKELNRKLQSVRTTTKNIYFLSIHAYITLF